MKLHEDKKLFEEAVRITALQKGIQPIYIEKDYWIVYVLYHIFNSSIGDSLIFKGGTSLSKCFDTIERFSEDIDLIIVKNKRDNDNILKKKIKAVDKLISELLPEINIEGITRKKGK